MKWAHVLLSGENVVRERINVPFDFIEDFEEIEVAPGLDCYVFWSPLPDETPQDMLLAGNKIHHYDKMKKVPGSHPAAWYPATVLRIADSEADLEKAIEGGRRVRVPSAAAARTKEKPKRSSAKGKELPVRETRLKKGSAEEKRLRAEAERKNLQTLYQQTLSATPTTERKRRSSDSKLEREEKYMVGKKMKKDKEEEVVCESLKNSEKLSEGKSEESSAQGVNPITSPKKLVPTCNISLPVSQSMQVKDPSVNVLKLEEKVDGCVQKEHQDKNFPVEDASGDDGEKIKHIQIEKQGQATSVQSKQTFNDSGIAHDAKVDSSSSESSLEDWGSSSSDVPHAVHQDLLEKYKEKKSSHERLQQKYRQLKAEVVSLQKKCASLEEEKMKLNSKICNLTELNFQLQLSQNTPQKTRSKAQQPEKLKITSTNAEVFNTPNFNTTGVQEGCDSSAVLSELPKDPLDASHEENFSIHEEPLNDIPSDEVTGMDDDQSSAVSISSADDWKLSEVQIQKLLDLHQRKTGAKEDSKFIKALIDLLWSREDLFNRSARGEGVLGKEGRQECTPAKKDYMAEILRRRCEREGADADTTEARVLLIPDYITSKICTTRRDLKSSGYEPGVSVLPRHKLSKKQLKKRLFKTESK